MTGRKSYTEIVATIETHMSYIQNHLRNIDSHLEKLNTTNATQNSRLDKQGTWLSAVKWVVGIMVTALTIIGTRAFGVW